MKIKLEQPEYPLKLNDCVSGQVGLSMGWYNWLTMIPILEVCLNDRIIEDTQISVYV